MHCTTCRCSKALSVVGQSWGLSAYKVHPGEVEGCPLPKFIRVKLRVTTTSPGFYIDDEIITFADSRFNEHLCISNCPSNRRLPSKFNLRWTPKISPVRVVTLKLTRKKFTYNFTRHCAVVPLVRFVTTQLVRYNISIFLQKTTTHLTHSVPLPFPLSLPLHSYSHFPLHSASLFLYIIEANYIYTISNYTIYLDIAARTYIDAAMKATVLELPKRNDLCRRWKTASSQLARVKRARELNKCQHIQMWACMCERWTWTIPLREHAKRQTSKKNYRHTTTEHATNRLSVAPE